MDECNEWDGNQKNWGIVCGYYVSSVDWKAGITLSKWHKHLFGVAVFIRRCRSRILVCWRYGKTGHVVPLAADPKKPAGPIPKSLLDTYTRMYDQEIAMREAINARLQIPLAIGVSVVTAQSYLFFAAKSSGLDVYLLLFILSTIAGLVLSMLSGVLFFRIFTGHNYEYLRTPREMEDYRHDCEAFYREFEDSNEYLDHWVKVSVDDELLEQLVRSATTNSRMNTERSACILTLHRLLLASIVASVVCVVFFVAGGLKDNPVHLVRAEIIGGANSERVVDLFGLKLPLEQLPSWLRNAHE